MDWQTPQPDFDTVIAACNLREFSLLTECFAYSRILTNWQCGNISKTVSLAKFTLHYLPEDKLLSLLVNHLKGIPKKGELLGCVNQVNDKSGGLALGVFDLFHIGHLRYLKYAREQVDCLTVAVISDRVCQKQKGKMPVIPQAHRVEIIKALRCVDQVDVMDVSTELEPQKMVSWVVSLKVNTIIVVGMWRDSERWIRLTALFKAKGIHVCFAPATDTVSSTSIVARIKNR
nr:adenylyltransferase/cytidyltransferase family protein [Thiomicrorhabdus cannonii]